MLFFYSQVHLLFCDDVQIIRVWNSNVCAYHDSAHFLTDRKDKEESQDLCQPSCLTAWSPSLFCIFVWYFVWIYSKYLKNINQYKITSDLFQKTCLLISQVSKSINKFFGRFWFLSSREIESKKEESCMPFPCQTCK